MIGIYSELKMHYQTNRMHTLIGPRVRALNSNIFTNIYALLLTFFTAVYLGGKSFAFIHTKRKSCLTLKGLEIKIGTYSPKILYVLKFAYRSAELFSVSTTAILDQSLHSPYAICKEEHVLPEPLGP